MRPLTTYQKTYYVLVAKNNRLNVWSSKYPSILRLLRIQAQILHGETGDTHACALLSFKHIMLCFAQII